MKLVGCLGEWENRNIFISNETESAPALKCDDDDDFAGFDLVECDVKIAVLSSNIYERKKHNFCQMI